MLYSGGPDMKTKRELKKQYQSRWYAKLTDEQREAIKERHRQYRANRPPEQIEKDRAYQKAYQAQLTKEKRAEYQANRELKLMREGR